MSTTILARLANASKGLTRNRFWREEVMMELSETIRRAIAVLERQRPYAAMWEGATKELKEAAVMGDFLAARQIADPPDFRVRTRRGGTMAIELTELVSSETIVLNLDACRAGRAEQYYRDWQPDDVLTAVQGRLNEKDGKKYHGGPYKEIHLVIHTDEPLILAEKYRPVLTGYVFARPAQLTRAFVLLSPDEGVCPLIELRFAGAVHSTRKFKRNASGRQ